MNKHHAQLFFATLLTAKLATWPQAEAANYNFYFNNAEQGDNSTASPTVTVEVPDAKKLEDQSNESRTEAEPEKKLGTSEATKPEPPIKKLFTALGDAPERRFRLWGSLMHTTSSYPKQNIAGREDKSNLGNEDTLDLLLGAGIYPFKHLGFNAFLGTHSRPKDTAFLGIELDFMPINTAGFELGILGGAWTLAKQKHADDMFKGAFGQSWTDQGDGTGYVGLRLGFKLNPTSERRVAWIANVAARGNSHYVNVDAGLGMMF